MRIGGQVSFPQLAWFLYKPVEPFHTSLLHPGGCLADITRMEIKCGNHGHHYRVDPSKVTGNPFLLAWTATAYEYDIGTTFIDLFYVCCIFFRRSFSEPVG